MARGRGKSILPIEDAWESGTYLGNRRGEEKELATAPDVKCFLITLLSITLHCLLMSQDPNPHCFFSGPTEG